MSANPVVGCTVCLREALATAGPTIFDVVERYASREKKKDRLRSLKICFKMSETILLCPRPLARYGGRFVLLPLLPHRPPLKPLPAEIWSHIFSLALSVDASQRSHRRPTTGGLVWCVSLMLVCKSFRVRPSVNSDVSVVWCRSMAATLMRTGLSFNIVTLESC